MKNWLGMVLLACFALGACAGSAAPDMGWTGPASRDGNPIFVVRHLQKAQGEDPPLSSEGAQAAERLAVILADQGILAIYATPTRRAMETAASLARRTGVAITQYDPRNPDALVASVAASDGAVLVVGHSNTVPDLVARFGGSPVPRLTDEDYGTVYVIDARGEVRELSVE